MNCDVIQGLFSGFIDGELTAQEHARVKQHVSDCEGCRMGLLKLRQLDVRLQALAVPQSLESRILDAVRSEAVVPPDKLPSTFDNRKRIAAAVVGVAAVIALWVVWLRSPMRDPGGQAPWAAVVVRSIGNVQVMAPGAEGWSDVDGSATRLISGSRIKTPEQGACEVATRENAQLRLDANTELVLRNSSRLQVLRGQVWCQASPQQSLTLDTPAPEAAAPPLGVFSCPVSSELQVRVGPRQAVAVGTEPASKVWQLPLLAINAGQGGNDPSELVSLVEMLLANVGRSKMQFMDEAQIRALGPRGAIPLLIYVREQGSGQQPAIRRRAMQIACELADDAAVNLLSELAADSDPLIRQRAQATIDRLAVPWR